LENLIKNFKSQLDNLIKEANSFTKKSISECEDRIKLLFDRVDERIRDTRVENANFMLDFQKTVDDLKSEIVNITELKKDILKKFDEELLLIKHDNRNVVDTFGNYKKDFFIMKDRLTQLANFIKDVRFRTNIRKSEFFGMAKKINFDKNQTLKDNRYAESDELFKDDWLSAKKPMEFESGLKKYIKGEINANEVGIITAKDKGKPNNSLNTSYNSNLKNNINSINNKSNVNISIIKEKTIVNNNKESNNNDKKVMNKQINKKGARKKVIIKKIKKMKKKNFGEQKK
jgi:hypothetical protein